MSKVNANSEELGEVIEGTLSRAELFLAKNKNILLYGIIAVLAIIIGYFAYQSFIVKPKNKEAAVSIYKAEQALARDSFELALKGDGNNVGFEYVASTYSSTPSGKLANYYAGVCEMKLGNFDKALTHLKKFSPDDEIFAARVNANMGDCYSEAGDNDNALKYYLKAADKRDNTLAATYLMKASSVYETKGEYTKAITLYEKIKYDYSESTAATDIDKYIERAKVLEKK